MLKQIARTQFMQAALGLTAAEYLRLVWKTSRFVTDPPDIYGRLEAELPVIFAFWHGQHFMVPFAKPDYYRAKVLISRHRDGEMNAIAAARLGVEAIRGSGDRERRFDRKGGVSAFMAMLGALEDGWSMAMTADVPKVARRAGMGIIKLAENSGRPIYPVAVATSRRVTLKSWDRAAVNLPFSRGAIAVGDPVRVEARADADALEAARRAVEERLDAVTTRAYAIVDRPEGARG